jgi:hypothetical protein
MARPPKTVLRRSPGRFEWTVQVCDRANDEARRLLSDSQLEHAFGLVRRLASQPQPTVSAELSLDAVEDFFEIRDKGGVLHPINLRIYYGVDKANRTIVVLGVDHKKNDGPMSLGKKRTMAHRWKEYQRLARG